MFTLFSKKQAAEEVRGLDCPALLVDHDGNVLSSSYHSDQLVALLGQEKVAFDAIISGVCADGKIRDTSIHNTQSSISFSLFAFPAPKKNQVIFIGRDMTLHDQVTTALSHSRAMFRDMAVSGSLFCYEVDHEGRFTYVGSDLGSGALFGIPADQLLGQKAEDILWPKRKPKGINPFNPENRQDGSGKDDQFATNPIRTMTPDGEFYIGFTGIITRDEQGSITYVRGMARDMTARMAEKNLARHHTLRMTLQSKMIRLLQQNHTAADLLDQAAAILQEMLRADTCSIFLKTPRGLALVADHFHDEDLTLPSENAAKPACEQAAPSDSHEILSIDALTSALAGQPSGDGAFELVIPRYNNQQTVLVVRLIKDSQMHGLVMIKRNSETFPWSAQEKALLSGIAEHMILALNQAEQIEKLTYLSNQDDLTGLMNRRAFMDMTNQRLKYAASTGQTNVILYVDLDNFKQVNDTLGHAAGDLTLKLVADMLRANSRDEDCVARIGGDEFLVWMTGSNQAAGEKKAQAMLAAMAPIRSEIGSEADSLSLSIGIIQSDSTASHTTQDMVDTADRLMYQAKQKGKGTFVMGTMQDLKRSAEDIGDTTADEGERNYGL